MRDPGRRRRFEVEAERLGRHLRELRLALGLSQEEAAGRVGIAPRHLQRAEAGTANLGLEVLTGFAMAYKVSIAGLFEPLPDETAQLAAEPPGE